MTGGVPSNESLTSPCPYSPYLGNEKLPSGHQVLVPSRNRCSGGRQGKLNFLLSYLKG